MVICITRGESKKIQPCARVVSRAEGITIFVVGVIKNVIFKKTVLLPEIPWEQRRKRNILPAKSTSFAYNINVCRVCVYGCIKDNFF